MLLTVVEALFWMKQLNISGQYGKTKLGFHQYIRRVVSALIHVLWSHRQVRYQVCANRSVAFWSRLAYKMFLSCEYLRYRYIIFLTPSFSIFKLAL